MRLTRRGRNLRDVALATLLTIPLAFAASLDYAEAAPPPDRESVQYEGPKQSMKAKPAWKCKNWAAKILHEAGFRGERHRQAWAITWRESKHQNLGPDSPWFSGALGLWQIQTSAHSGKSWWSYGAMMDPLTQSKIVYKHMSGKGRNWQAWGLTASGQLDPTQYGGWGPWQWENWIMAPYRTGLSLYPCKSLPPPEGPQVTPSLVFALMLARRDGPGGMDRRRNGMTDSHIRFTFTVLVKAPTLEQAKQVMAERINHDEDLGFPYTVEVVV